MRKSYLISLCIFSLTVFELGGYLNPLNATEVRSTQDERTVTGVIRDTEGEPVIGASVMQTGTLNGTVTDLDGNFTLTVPSDAELTVSCIGYEEHVFRLDSRDRYEIVLNSWMKWLSWVWTTVRPDGRLLERFPPSTRRILSRVRLRTFRMPWPENCPDL